MTRALALLAAWATSCAAYAAPFADPTRPPGALDSERGAPTAGPRLESVLIAPDRRVAVIGGQEVTIGSRFRDGEVTGISESEVRIRRPDGEQSLKLYPGAGRRPAAKER